VCPRLLGYKGLLTFKQLTDLYQSSEPYLDYVLTVSLYVNPLVQQPELAILPSDQLAMAADDWFLWAPKWQARLKAFTLVACGAAVFANMTADWESQFGEQHCFSGVKPGLKRFFNNVLGINSSGGNNVDTMQRQPVQQ